eukprot:m.276778 g.276778  ORF g.276778 m.276778 type:complete len:99 (+) comp126259_c0_seq1:119-415(+)
MQKQRWGCSQPHVRVSNGCENRRFLRHHSSIPHTNATINPAIVPTSSDDKLLGAPSCSVDCEVAGVDPDIDVLSVVVVVVIIVSDVGVMVVVVDIVVV